MPIVFDPESSKGEAISFAGKRQSIKFDAGGAPIGALVTRLNFDGDKDLLILREGVNEPAVMLTAPEAAFTVNNNGDAVDNNIGNGVCSTAGGVCTLRAAIQEANRLAGNDSITINAGINITLNPASRTTTLSHKTARPRATWIFSALSMPGKSLCPAFEYE